MNLTGQPIHAKEIRPPDNPAYLDAVRAMPSIICEEYGEVQLSPTTAHHPIMGRYSGRKRPDITAIPTCDGHHQGTFDTSKVAVHREPALWRKMYGKDIDYTPRIQDRLAHLMEGISI
jgi:hypothetical protein